MPAQRHLSVEARLVRAAPGRLILEGPPAALGARVSGFAATDDRGAPVSVQNTGGGWTVDLPGTAPLRFRYQLQFADSVSAGSTASGLDPGRLYAVTRAIFVAPDPVLYGKTGKPYPVVRLAFVLPRGWTVVSAWDSAGPEIRPRSGTDLLRATLAAAPDYRMYEGHGGGAAFTLAIRGVRVFSDSALMALLQASLDRAAATFGPVPVQHVTYIADTGRKGRTSGSLQGTSSIGLLWEPGEMLERERSHDTFHETIHLWFGGAVEAERWWTEGVTDYFAARFYASWRNDPADLAALCYESLRNYSRIRHRLTTTMAAETRTMGGSDNTTLLVYRKGMLAGLLLDAAIRRDTHGRASLDDVARDLLAVGRADPGRVLGEDAIGEAVARVGGKAAVREWRRVALGTGPISGGEVAAALREVTGVDLPPPPARGNIPKVLSAERQQ